MRAKVKSLKVRNQVDSNHQPIIMHVKGKEKRKGMAGKKRIEKKEKVWDWLEKKIKQFKEKTKKVELRRMNIDEKLEELKEDVRD